MRSEAMSPTKKSAALGIIAGSPRSLARGEIERFVAVVEAP